MAPYVQKPPKTKRDLLNRMLSRDFDGDFRHLGEGARVSRVDASTIELRFENINRTFLLSVHIPREGGEAEEEFSAPVASTRRSNTSQ